MTFKGPFKPKLFHDSMISQVWNTLTFV